VSHTYTDELVIDADEMSATFGQKFVRSTSWDDAVKLIPRLLITENHRLISTQKWLVTCVYCRVRQRPPAGVYKCAVCGAPLDD